MIEKTYIVGNWKMNLSYQEAVALAKALAKDYQPQNNLELVIAPQFPMLFPLSEIIKNTELKLSAQNCAAAMSGAYTGEVSPNLLETICDYCIVGHSERRSIFGESPEQVAKKFFLLQELAIVPVFCIGETLEQREAGKLETVLKEQLQPIFGTKNPNFLVAYEPVWAIGTGKVATTEQVAAVHLFLTKLLAENLELEKKIPLLYGGSVKSENAKELLAINNLHGLLVGGASLKKEDFLKIATSK